MTIKHDSTPPEIDEAGRLLALWQTRASTIKARDLFSLKRYLESNFLRQSELIGKTYASLPDCAIERWSAGVEFYQCSLIEVGAS
jgi:hypothetical protein